MRPNRPPLDDDSATRMLQGLVHADDAPPGYGAVAGLLAAAAARPASVDEDAAAATVSAMVGAIREGAPIPQTSRRKSMLTKLLAGKALAALGVVALTASGAAAATGSLPTPVQSAVSGAASHVGVDLPHPNHGNSAAHRQDGKHRPGTDTTSTTGGTGDNGASSNHGQTVSQTAHSTPDGPGKGAAVCAVASGGKCQAGNDPGKDSASDDDSSSTTATTGGIQTGEDHNGDHATTPTTGSIQTGEDHNDDHATTPTTGSIQTGVDHSGGSAGSGKGGSGSSGTDDSGSQH
ncbi:MAG TPA: hypothetical protein VFE55_02235 [Acidimicrobiia bacterium]|nr:hypothetical protein [Acidimicrobiia bacterium]